jgi:predicted DNA-binding transcriptional regulator AlpA
MDSSKTILQAIQELRQLLERTDREPAVLLSGEQVLERLGLGSRTTLYMYIDRHGFPKGRQVGGSTRWIEAEVNAWIHARPLATQSVRQPVTKAKAG